MYAVIRSGGKQYKVCPGDLLDLEKLPAESGSRIELSDVLLTVDGENVRIGMPVVDQARVLARVVGQVRGNKIVVYKFKKRKRYRRKSGHRQDLTRIRIEEIQT